jgi:hypothetical protein
MIGDGGMGVGATDRQTPPTFQRFKDFQMISAVRIQNSKQ